MSTTKQRPDVGPLVRMPSGKTCGAELTADGLRVVPHEYFCNCQRCKPEMYAAAPAMLEALRAVLLAGDCEIEMLDAIAAVIAKATGDQS